MIRRTERALRRPPLRFQKNPSGLAAALKSSGARGRWGELQLRRYEEHLREKQTQIEKSERKLEEQQKEFTIRITQAAAANGPRSLWPNRR